MPIPGNHLPGRIFMRLQDLENMFGCSERTAMRKMSDIRKALGKESRAPITVYDFCKVTGMEVEEVLHYINSY